mgnify:CR=1 FL=1
MKKLSQNQPVFSILRNLDNIEEIVDILLEKVPENKLKDMVHDYLLIEYFIKKYDKNSVLFLSTFDSLEVGLEEGTQLGKRLLEKYDNIDDALDEIAELIVKDKKLELAKKHLIELYFTENCGADITSFIDNLNVKYWDWVE